MILAVDIATVCGYALLKEDNTIESGTVSFKRKSTQSNGMQFLLFENWIEEKIKTHKVKYVFYENSTRFFRAAKSHANFEGILLKLSAQYSLEYDSVTATQLKKYATGKGNCKKLDMVIAAIDIFNIFIEDDNHADALFILDYFRKKYKL